MTMFIAWIDVETDGLPERGFGVSRRHLLQVGCIITDMKLNQVGDEFQRTIHLLDYEVAYIRENAHPVVREMHDKNGLWGEVQNGTPLQQVDQELANFISNNTGGNLTYFGGNSITLDREFVREYLPISDQLIHYRSIDATSISLMFTQWAGAENWDNTKGSEHTALADLHKCIAQIRAIKDKVTRQQ